MRLTRLVGRLVANRPQDLQIRRDDGENLIILFKHSETANINGKRVPVTGWVVFGPVDAKFVSDLKDEIIKLGKDLV